MNKRVFYLVSDSARTGAKLAIDDPVYDGWKVTMEEPGKTRDQEEKYHAMIGDIAKHCLFMGEKHKLEDWKRLLVDAFVRVMRAEAQVAGRPDPFAGQGRVLPNLDGTGFVQLGVQTRRFGKRMASEFIEYLYAYGSENQVPWSQAALRAYDELRRAA